MAQIFTLLTSVAQILGDLICLALAAYLFFSTNVEKKFRTFYGMISLSFGLLALADFYYNYLYRLTLHDIKQSASIIVTLPFIFFQISQLYNWWLFKKEAKLTILSQQNTPYLLSASLVVVFLLYFFASNETYPINTLTLQGVAVSVDMVIWLFAIICLANTLSLPITLLALGCLLIISSDLTTRCLYVFEPTELATTKWVHIVWTLGVWVTATGLFYCTKCKSFKFSKKNSLLVYSNAQMVLTAFIAFVLGITFLVLFKLTNNIDMHTVLWSLPIVLIFTLILSILLAKNFSRMLTQPLNEILQRIHLFETKDYMPTVKLPTKINEFEILSNFIDSTFQHLSEELEQGAKVAAQVSHDISSPLSSLDVLIKANSELDETNRVFLRNAVADIRSIVDSLQRDTSKEIKPTQLIVIMSYAISQANMLIRNTNIEIKENVVKQGYHLFVNVSSSVLKTILANLINNAVEAIGSKNGYIAVNITEKKGQKIAITIRDNGIGLSEEKQKNLFRQGFTTKETGSGIGLFSAQENLALWGGTIIFDSIENKGSTVTIELPMENIPSYFTPYLLIPKGGRVICIDDSLSVGNAWKVRLMKYAIVFSYLKNKEELKNELFLTELNESIFLVDYEFPEGDYTGQDLIVLLLKYNHPPENIYLVTSRSEEPEIQQFCLDVKVKILPKVFVSKIPIHCE